MAAQKFRARIEAIGPGGSWSRMKIPFNVEEVWESRARVSVKGKINGFAFRSSIFPDGEGGHTIMINKAMQTGAKVAPGEFVEMELDRDTGSREQPTPADLRKALEKNSKVKDTFSKFSESHRNEYIQWIESAKRLETRAARIKKTIAMIALKKHPR
jgi:Bacteriocin-protection, YdeI or OmpD-Associated/Domain of unknown function (DUF1905)